MILNNLHKIWITHSTVIVDMLILALITSITVAVFSFSHNSDTKLRAEIRYQKEEMTRLKLELNQCMSRQAFRTELMKDPVVNKIMNSR